MTRRSNQIHDLKGVYTDFKIVFDLIKSGYRFDDQNAPEILEQLEKALSSFKIEITNLEKADPDFNSSAVV